MGTTRLAPRLAHVPALDGVRGVAVAGVLLFHGGHLAGGYLGVDLFFVLSGFLITSLLLAESASRGRVALGGFWARRARRLLPALAGMLVGVAVYAAVFAQPSELGELRGAGLATLGYVANWRAVFAPRDYWALFRTPSPLEHTWSLAIEEQFYLVWPLVFVGLVAWWKRAVPKAVLVTSLVLALGSSVLTVALFDPANVSRVYYGTDTRIAAVLMGAALAAWLAVRGPARGRSTRLALEAAGVAGAIVLAVAWSRLSGRSATLYRGGFAVSGIAAVAVIAAAAHPEAGLVSRVLGLRPLRLLGLVSYGVYLWHWPVYVVLDKGRSGLGSWALLAVRVAVTLAIAGASFLLLEQPIRRGALSARQWRVLGPAVAAGLVALTLVVTTSAAPPIAVASPSASAWSIRTTAPGAPRRVRVLVVGDSVAVSLFPGLQHTAPSYLDVVLGSAVGCDAAGHRHGFDATPPPTTPCPSAWSQLVVDLRPDVVLMVDSGVWSLHDGRVDGRLLRLGTSEWDANRVAQWQQSVDTFAATGARVVIPTIAYVRARSEAAVVSDSVLNPASVDRANADLAALAARNPGRVSLVDLRSYVCPQGRYQEGLGPVDELRPDGVHYGPAGADLVGRWLVPRLATHATGPRP